ncbi:uncharacterized protein FRV6_02670 [Fusarium oxysporum]|uniref:Uncharacterized protein n=1 Tax=Fusarium oxysporum TaxID=5507 RepID=A0A2H3SPT2_FUSOX|nr:uncharacterized protein FRV6_02670 [Fusarium oxysporum]
MASKLLPTRNRHTALARRCCQYNTLRFLYGQSREALLGRTAPLAEDNTNSDWDDKTGSSQEDEEGEGESDRGGDGQALGGRGSEEDQAAGEGWKPPRILRAVTTEYPVHILRDSICITSEPRRTKEGNFNVAAVWAFSHPNIFNLAHSDEAWAAVARKGNIKASRQDAE